MELRMEKIEELREKCRGIQEGHDELDRKLCAVDERMEEYMSEIDSLKLKVELEVVERNTLAEESKKLETELYKTQEELNEDRRKQAAREKVEAIETGKKKEKKGKKGHPRPKSVEKSQSEMNLISKSLLKDMSNRERLEHLLNTDLGRAQLIHISKERFCEENIYFLFAIRDFKKEFGSRSVKDIRACAKEIVDNFVRENSPQQNYLEDTTSMQLIDSIFTGQDLTSSFFDEAYDSIFEDVVNNIVPRIF